MRTAVLGALVGAGLVMAACGLNANPGQAYADQARVPYPSGTELITFTSPAGDSHQQLIVIDPKLRVLSVYHVDLATGEVALKSVRQIHWDLQLSEFNGVNPLPREIRLMLEQR